MKRVELEEIIRQEIRKTAKVMIPKLIKPMVQEAVAGAMASLIAEGIVNNSQKSVTNSNKPIRENSSTSISSLLNDKKQTPKNKGITTQEEHELARDKIRNKLRQVQNEVIQYENESSGINEITTSKFGNGPIGEILSEMSVRGPSVPSVLDNISEETTSPEVVNAITRDYSALMKRLNG